MVDLIEIKDEESYYKNLKFGIEMSKMWDILREKTEYGSKQLEIGYQMVACSMARTIAKSLGMNYVLAEILTMCKGAYFPPFGKQGRKVIMEYLKQNNIDISESDLAREYIENELYKSSNIITPKFDELLKNLFEDLDNHNIYENEDISEVNIARMCEEVINYIKIIEQNLKINSDNLLYKLSEHQENYCIETKKLEISPKIKKLLEAIPYTNEYEITVKDKNKIIEKIKHFIEFTKANDGSNIEGICDYIGTGNSQT